MRQVFRARTPLEAMDLVARLLEYTPSLRMTPLDACAHSFFDELREQGTRLPNGRELPPLFNFTEHELRIQPTLNSLLIPKYMQPADGSQPAGSAAPQTDGEGAGGQGGAASGEAQAGSGSGTRNSNEAQANAAAPATQNQDPSQSNMA